MLDLAHTEAGGRKTFIYTNENHKPDFLNSLRV
jgi:hypothetical protein